MHKKPAPLRVVATSDPEERHHSDEQLVLERRAPKSNRHVAVEMNMIVILFLSALAAGAIYEGIGGVVDLGEFYNWRLFLSMVAPLFAAFTYFMFLADRGPGWTAEGYKYTGVSRNLRDALASPDGQRLLARAVAEQETIHGARYLSGEDARNMERDLRVLLITHGKKLEAMENEKFNKALSSVPRSPGIGKSPSLEVHGTARNG